MILICHRLVRLLLSASLLLIFCEFLVYYLVVVQCSWPELPSGDTAPGAEPGANNGANNGVGLQEPLHAVFLADTHLLGSRQGHWFDRLRREWQMERAFQTAITLTNPEVVFILGDLTDEGKWANDQEFGETVARFNRMFKVPGNVAVHVVVGNHDIGFHQSVSESKLNRFEKAFNTRPVTVLTIKDNVFVLLNSMAMHGDGCFMCSPAMDKLRSTSERLNCSRFGFTSGRVKGRVDNDRCPRYSPLPAVAPILLQHFPLYRSTESSCQGPDAPTQDELTKLNTERYDVLSKKASEQLLSWLQPRVILSGHAHHGCYVIHRGDVPELTVPSFSWRNRNNPSLIMATISKDHFEYTKCFIPQETSVITTYVFFVALMSVWFLMSVLRSWGRNFKRFDSKRH